MQMFIIGSIKTNWLNKAVQQNSSNVEGIFQFLSYKFSENFRWLAQAFVGVSLHYWNSSRSRTQSSLRKVSFNSLTKECQIIW